MLPPGSRLAPPCSATASPLSTTAGWISSTVNMNGLVHEMQRERGASAVEYGLLVAGIAAVIIGAVFLFGQGIFSNLFQQTCNSIGQNMNSTC